MQQSACRSQHAILAAAGSAEAVSPSPGKLPACRVQDLTCESLKAFMGSIPDPSKVWGGSQDPQIHSGNSTWGTKDLTTTPSSTWFAPAPCGCVSITDVQPLQSSMTKVGARASTECLLSCLTAWESIYITLRPQVAMIKVSFAQPWVCCTLAFAACKSTALNPFSHRHHNHIHPPGVQVERLYHSHTSPPCLAAAYYCLMQTMSS